ncbi:DHH family phosphoesterase [Candidatus Woesearchaeota archaeon]|nr:DHH family phosphoesterase [Candidatus Woesearchaeota archaeon]
MDKYEEFYKHVQKAADEFRAIPSGEVIRIISHLDADGLSSASILVKAMTRCERQYIVTIVQKLDAQLAEQLEGENYRCYAFSDLGSGQFSTLAEKMPSKKIHIFDHHKLEDQHEAPNITHVNPHLFGIDGSKEVSGAGVAYLFARALDIRNKDMAHIAIIGAIGDVQESDGFEKVNTCILSDAVESGKMKVIPGLKLFGAQTKPLHKLLSYGSEYNIPGVTGSESGAVQFLMQLGIALKDGGDWRKLVDLSDEELQRLVAGVMIKRAGEPNPQAIIGKVYILREEEKQSPLRDAKEFSTLLNACGRMDKPMLGIGACIGDEELKPRAIAHLADYKRELMKSISWFEESYKNGGIIKGGNYIIINAGENIRHTMIGTLASMVAKSNTLGEGTFILSLARMDDGNTKASIRMSGNGSPPDLREVISAITERVNGSYGGHMGAAGAVISTEMEQQFIEAAKEIFTKAPIPETQPRQ